MLNDREFLRRRQAQPALVKLHNALGRLSSTLTVMNTGAHPDDEQSGMLALMRFSMGMRVIIACSTRGEGGQNTLGPERTGALGVMRSREMEEAARVLDADIAWLGHGPDDPVHDFGFSKSGPDTLARWGKERTIERLVRAYRQWRPDIVIPTFLDVPGQHGHHRAMTEAAETALALAADANAFPEHFAEGLSVWQVAKYYLPAWSGGGDYYDDEVPPPPVTVSVTADGNDAASGAPYDMVGEFSRAFHGSQVMGHWRAEPVMSWPLHLLHGAAENDIRAHLPATLGDIADRVTGVAAGALREAQDRIDAAIAAFPHGQAITSALIAARGAIENAQGQLDAAHAAAFGHRLERKLAEIDAALLLSAGFAATAWVEPANVAPGAEAMLKIALQRGQAQNIALSAVSAPFVTVAGAASGEAVVSIPLRVAADAPIRNAFLPDFSALGGNGLLSVALTAEVAGQQVQLAIDLEEALQIVPPASVELTPDAVIVPLGQSVTRTIRIRSDAARERISIDGTDHLALRATATGLEFTAQSGLGAGRYDLAVRLDGQQAYALSPIDYPHIGRTHFVRPQALQVLALELSVPRTRIGYVGAGSDRVDMWLERMGADVTALDAEALAGDLSQYDTIVVGIFAFGERGDLKAALPRLHQWVNEGGHLVTLYHRPWDNWVPETTPPKRVVIGAPSLRWRVTNPDADVDILAPEHPLMAGPNVIGAEDFAGWDKERGLYFAAEWNDAYTPLLAMHDAGEQPLTGSLISGQIGKGRHTHTSLVLHHQLDRLVPGAFRLLANLVQRA